jgi:hypothetical protein
MMQKSLKKMNEIAPNSDLDEILDFRSKQFSMHFCPKATNCKYDCDYIYCIDCYVKPSAKRKRTTTEKAKNPMDAEDTITTGLGCDDHRNTLFNECDNSDRKYFEAKFCRGKSIPTHCKGCNKRIVVE